MDENPQPPQEFFDIPLNLYGWGDDKENYKIIAELIPQTQNTHELIIILDEINQILSEKKLPFIFDGTIDSLKYFIDEHGLDINKITNPKLKEVVKKYLDKPNSSETIQMNPNRWSGQALRCKAILVGLYVKNGRLQIVKGLKSAEHLKNLNEFDFPVFDDDIENGHVSEESVMRLTSLNATWAALAHINPWSKDKTRGIDKLVIEEMMNSFSRGSIFNSLFIKLQPHINKIAEKYFHGFHKTDHRACTAARHAAIIVLYRTTENIPKDAIRHPDFRVDGFTNKWLEYIFTEQFEFQDWFIKYFSKEMDTRIKFLKILADAKIYMEVDPQVEEIMKQRFKDKYKPPRKDMLYYLPIFESFRFIAPGSISSFGRLVTIFHNKEIPTSEKEEMAKNMVFNIQKLIATREKPVNNRSEINDSSYLFEESKQEAFMMLVLNILAPLAHGTLKKHSYTLLLNKVEFDDLNQIITDEILTSILKYDSTKNPSFFGYIKSILPLRVKTTTREKKTNQISSSLDELSESNPAIVGEETNLYEPIKQDELQEKVSKCLNNLSKKEKQAIEKAYFNNSKLNATERRAKNRGLQHLKEMYPELKDFIN